MVDAAKSAFLKLRSIKMRMYMSVWQRWKMISECLYPNKISLFVIACPPGTQDHAQYLQSLSDVKLKFAL